ncbi:MAG TPA: imidazolonepropionase, partial [Candidatus Lustribacter sp.]|nr:imidazolonepropionase [Candidatus Lustribacter sp.]
CEGALADFVAVGLTSPRTAGSEPGQVLLSATSADVTDVVVGGRRVVADRQHRLGDVGQLLADAIHPLGGLMSSLAVTGIGELVTNDSSLDATRDGDHLGLLHDVTLVVDNGRVAWIGPSGADPPADRAVDLGGRAVVPGFVDSHTHLVFAGERSAEFAARMSGIPYDGGGIAATVAATRAASDDELRALLAGRVAALRALGTTTFEVKSGYGLAVEDEARLLRLAREVTAETTFLGAHVVPPEYRGDRDGYVGLVTGPMLAACAPYARWVDVFCEPHSPHAFTGDEARAVLIAGRLAGLEGRVHGNQLGPGPGVQLAVELGAASVDHCTYLADRDVDALVSARDATVATLLPGVEFSTRSPYPDARRLIDAGASVALASDCNPGTHYSGSIPFVLALAVREMHLTPAEALRAATVGGAAALRRPELGRLTIGSPAHLTVVDAPTYVHLVYRPGMPLSRAFGDAVATSTADA